MMARCRRAGGPDFLHDVLRNLGDQPDFLRAFFRPRLVFLVCIFLCPLFVGFTTLALFGHILALAYFWALYLAFVLPLPIAVFLAWYLFAEVIPGEIIADITSEVPPRRVYPTWAVQHIAAPRQSGMEYKRQALRERLLQVCDERFLQRRVAQLARGYYRVTDARVNAHLRGTSYVLERFLDTLLQHEESLPDLWEHLSSSPSLDPFVVAFHGTPPANIPSILAHGLLPTSRKSNPLCDYFSTDLTVTRQYVDRANWYRPVAAPFQAVVFLLLKKEPGVVDHYSFIVMRHAAYQLPLGVVTVEADYGPQEI